MAGRRWNWPLWSGLLLSIVAFLSYPFFFAQFPPLRDVPWANFALFVVAVALVIVGLRRAFSPTGTRKARIGATIAGVLSAVILGMFLLQYFVTARQLPASAGAPKPGQMAPGFRLTDTQGRTVSLAELLSTPVAGKAPRGVLLVFYRGYW